MRRLFLYPVIIFSLLVAPWAFAAGKAEHVVVIVWDGMRPDFISAENTPTLWKLVLEGVMFTNHHPVYPSSTEVNGTAIATGAYPKDSGIIGNREYRPTINALRSVDTQDSATIHKGDALSHGRYILCDTVAETLQAAGKTTAIVGTKAVAQLHDRHARADDYRLGSTVFETNALPVSLEITLDDVLGKYPKAEPAESSFPNEKRDEWSTRALTQVLWSNGVPSFSLLWLSDPDSSQHPSGPGAPKSIAAIQSCDRKLAEVLTELDRHKMRDKTDIFIVSDHGFSTIDRKVDVCEDLQQAGFSAVREFATTPQAGQILVNGVGGSVLFYVTRHDSVTTHKLVIFLEKQDFSGTIFTREKMAGTFLLSDVKADSPAAPDVLMSMRWSEGKSRFGAPGMLTLDNSRTNTTVILGSHASLSHYDMHNTLVGAGPDLKSGLVDTFPTGNTDLAPTILWLLGVKPAQHLDGRVLSEALTVKAPKAGAPKKWRLQAKRAFDDSAWTQYLQISRVNDTVYFDEGNGSNSALTPKHSLP